METLVLGAAIEYSAADHGQAAAHAVGICALIASNLGGSSHDLMCFSQYFGGVNRILAGHGQMRQIAGGFMNGSVARGAQVLGFKVHLNLHLF